MNKYNITLLKDNLEGVWKPLLQKDENIWLGRFRTKFMGNDGTKYFNQQAIWELKMM